MKKLLSIISTFMLIPALSVGAVSCTNHSSEYKNIVDVYDMIFTNIYVKVNDKDKLSQNDVDSAEKQAKESIQCDLLKYNKNADVNRDIRLD